MASLQLDSRLPHPDDFYAALLDMHRDLSDAESAKANAKLILILANHVADMEVLLEAMRLARGDARRPATG